MAESFATVLDEVSRMSAAVSQTREMLLQIDAINQDPQLAGPAADGAESDGRSQRGEIFLATLGGACVCDLRDGGHICCGVAKCAT